MKIEDTQKLLAIQLLILNRMVETTLKQMEKEKDNDDQQQHGA